jgi:hypothetical protein
MSAEENKWLMKTLGDAWNSQDWDTCNKRHPEEVAAGQQETLTVSLSLGEPREEE